MRIPFRDQYNSRDYAFIMEFELENISANKTDTSNIRIQGTLRRAVEEPRDGYPIILELHGRITRTNGQGDGGATLAPVRELPLTFQKTTSQQWLDLQFTFPLPYLQMIEEQRQGQDISLLLEMWGLVAMVQPRDKAQANLTQNRPTPIEVLSFEKIETERSSTNNLTIPRSTWIDRILPSLGYGRSIIIELPLVHALPIPEAFRNAAQALDNARNAFSREDYRGAVKYGREVTEFLEKSCSGEKSLTNFCREYLEPIIGETKSKAIDLSLNSTRKITNSGSHANAFLVDRAIADHIIETLALNLRYISTVLQDDNQRKKSITALLENGRFPTIVRSYRALA